MKQHQHFQHLVCHYNIPYDNDPTSYPAQSRDYTLQGVINCKRLFCGLNKNGKCTMPSAIHINAKGICQTGAGFEPPSNQPHTLRNPREGD